MKYYLIQIIVFIGKDYDYLAIRQAMKKTHESRGWPGEWLAVDLESRYNIMSLESIE